MPYALRKNPFSVFPYGRLAPFLGLTVYGLIILYGWAGGKLVLVQPRSYDAVLPANAGVCLIFIGLAPLALALGWQKIGVSLEPTGEQLRILREIDPQGLVIGK